MAAMAIAVMTTFFAEGAVLWLIIGAMVLGRLWACGRQKPLP